LDTTTNYGLKKPADTDGADIEVISANMDIIDAELKKRADDISSLSGSGRTTETVKGNADNIAALQTGKADKTEIPTKLPNPSALTISQGYGGTTGTYDGSAAKTVSVPKITFHTSAPGTVADGELWGVY
jgi:hypothetical protein